MAKKSRGLSWEQYRIDGDQRNGVWIAYFNSIPIAEQVAPIGVLPVSFRQRVRQLIRMGMTAEEEEGRRLRISLLNKGINLDKLNEE